MSQLLAQPQNQPYMVERHTCMLYLLVKLLKYPPVAETLGKFSSQWSEVAVHKNNLKYHYTTVQ